MKRAAWVLLGAVAVLSGCAMHVPQDRVANLLERLSATPVVTVAGDRAMVGPEPAVVRCDSGVCQVVWTAPAGVSFASKDGIRIEGQLVHGKGEAVPARHTFKRPADTRIDRDRKAGIECRPKGDQSWSCTFDRKLAAPGVYKYTIQLRVGDRELIVDPEIFHPE